MSDEKKSGSTFYVHFACNHDNGEFSGRAVMAEFINRDDGATELHLTHGDIDPETGGVELKKLERHLQVMNERDGDASRRGLVAPASSWHRYVGNICWDGCVMAFEDAHALATYLVQHGGFFVDEVADGLFDDIEDNAAERAGEERAS